MTIEIIVKYLKAAELFDMEYITLNEQTAYVKGIHSLTTYSFSISMTPKEFSDEFVKALQNELGYKVFGKPVEQVVSELSITK